VKDLNERVARRQSGRKRGGGPGVPKYCQRQTGIITANREREVREFPRGGKRSNSGGGEKAQSRVLRVSRNGTQSGARRGKLRAVYRVFQLHRTKSSCFVAKSHTRNVRGRQMFQKKKSTAENGKRGGGLVDCLLGQYSAQTDQVCLNRFIGQQGGSQIKVGSPPRPKGDRNY